MNILEVFILFLAVSLVQAINIDGNGYILYCPCMGRFGNQADHFLGTLNFAYLLNRTFVVPPWVEYRPGLSSSVQVSFNTYFKVEELQKYHRVVTMEDFMQTIAPTVWPPEKRIVFCYITRSGSDGCAAKEGNPFGSFWNTFNVDFVGSEIYQPLSIVESHQNLKKSWNDRYPASIWPVLAFTGAPAVFPVRAENVILQKYLVWTEDIMSKVNSSIRNLPRGRFIGIHLRNGADWSKACKYIHDTPALFSGPQCLGYSGENGPATMDLCIPNEDTIIKHIKRIVKKIAAKSIFVASDFNHMIPFLNKNLSKMNVTAHKLDVSNPHLELAILSRSNHFIGNCISSFSAFAKRERDYFGLPSSFWAFPTKRLGSHNEL